MKATLQKGFTLIEAMIVLAIVGAVAVISLDMLTGAAKGEARRSMISQQATEMATLNRAVNEWVRTATALPTAAGAVMEVTLQDVITAGRLPAQFANRAASGSTLPTSPLGQRYRAFVRRTAGSRFEVVVFPAGAQNPGFAARAGVVQDPEAMRVWNVAVMQEVRQKHSLPAGVINQGTSDIDPAASGFTINLADFIGGPATASTVAALSNFAALETVAAAATAPPGGNPFLGKTCRATTAPCGAGETEASRYDTCKTWGLHRSMVPPLGDVGEIFVTPIGNLQITKSTNIRDSNAIPNQMPGLPPSTVLMSHEAGGAPITTWVHVDSWTGEYSHSAATCRHPSGQLWGCLPFVRNSPINNSTLGFNAAPTASQIVSGGIANMGPGISQNIAATEILWAHNHFTVDNVVRTGQRATCPGSVGAVPSPTWEQDLIVIDGQVGFGGSTDGLAYGITGPFRIRSIGPSQVYPSRFRQGPPGVAAIVTYSETTQVPGQSPITTICEENVISNLASVPNPRPSGWAGAALPAGVNACPSTSLVARFGTTNRTLLTARPHETFQWRPADAAMPSIHICCN